MSQNALYQSDCKIFKFIVSLEQIMKKLDFCMLIEIYGNWKVLGWAWSKIEMATLVRGHKNWLYLKKELMD